jgi:hypothetical protein
LVRLMSGGKKVEAFRFSKIRMAQRVLGIKGRVAAGIIGMPYGELCKGERGCDRAYPLCATGTDTRTNGRAGSEQFFKAAGKTYARQLRAILPFKRFRCRKCRSRVHVVGRNTRYAEVSTGISNARDVAAAPMPRPAVDV